MLSLIKILVYAINMFEECLYFNSNHLARRVTQIWESAYKERFSLSPAHAFLLRLVLKKPGLSSKAVSKELGLAQSTVTRFVDHLENNGYLKKKVAKSDAREQLIYPLKKALNIQHDLEQTGKELTKKMQEIFGVDFLSDTVKNMRFIAENLD